MRVGRTTSDRGACSVHRSSRQRDQIKRRCPCGPGATECSLFHFAAITRRRGPLPRSPAASDAAAGPRPDGPPSASSCAATLRCDPAGNRIAKHGFTAAVRRSHLVAKRESDTERTGARNVKTERGSAATIARNGPLRGRRTVPHRTSPRRPQLEAARFASPAVKNLESGPRDYSRTSEKTAGNRRLARVYTGRAKRPSATTAPTSPDGLPSAYRGDPGACWRPRGATARADVSHWSNRRLASRCRRR